MEAFATIITILVGLVGLDLVALRWGTDSRERANDDDGSWPIH